MIVSTDPNVQPWQIKCDTLQREVESLRAEIDKIVNQRQQILGEAISLRVALKKAKVALEYAQEGLYVFKGPSETGIPKIQDALATIKDCGVE